ncbi:hypothetical protein [[Actinomadura] parvosata]|uniref:hypothetical protein n=1 Tax=[Actinomadura] parvosata TaxID=1955412 RepID=UPI001648FF47
MIGDLAFQRRLQHPLGQLLQQATLTGQLQPLTAGPVHEHRDQLPAVSERSGSTGSSFMDNGSTAVSDIKRLFLDHQIRRGFAVLP